MTFSFSALSVSTGGVIGMFWICCRVPLNLASYSDTYNLLTSPLAQFQDIFMCSVAAVGIRLVSNPVAKGTLSSQL